MAEREAIVTIEERAAAIRAEAVAKRARVPESLRASNDADLTESFKETKPTVAAATPEAAAPDTAVSQEPIAPDVAATFEPAEAVTPATVTPPVANADDFGDEVSVVHDKARDTERQNFFKQQAAEGSPNKTGAIVQGAFAARQGENLEDRKKKEDAKRFKDLLKLLDDNINWLTGQLGRIDERLAAIAEERRGIDDALEALDELDELRPNGELDPNNPAHAALLRRAGLRPEDADRENLEFILRARRHELLEDRDRLDQEAETLREERREYQDDLDRAREIRERLERGDPAAERETQEFNDQIEERRLLNESAAGLDEQAARLSYGDRGFDTSEQAFALNEGEMQELSDEFDFDAPLSAFTTSFANSADPLSEDGERLATNFNEQAAATGPGGPEHDFQTGVNIAVPARSA